MLIEVQRPEKSHVAGAIMPTAAACIDLPQVPKMLDVVYGLGGRDCRVEDIRRVYDHLYTIMKTGEVKERYLHMGQRSNEKEVL